jgi:phenylacetate-CoA ligase
MKRWFIWNVIFRAHECAKKHATYRYLREMEIADRFSPTELDELQRRKLRDLIEYSYAHVPYWRTRMNQLGLKPLDIRGPADLSLLPLMRKADARANREMLRSEIAGKMASFTTGGSTGDPLIFDLAKRRVASRVACRQRTSRWWGVSFGDPELAIWGSPVELTRQDAIRNIRDRFLATRLLSAFEMNDAVMSRYLDVLESGHYVQVFGYPSALYLLCLHARREKRNLRRLGVKVAFVTGEVLFPYQREVISETLSCPVANGYGGRDSALIAHECPQGGMHVLADAVILETVDSDGRPVPEGEPGEIVITDLYSHEAPFIRYATGDIATVSSRSCPCGRALPLLERIEGRSNDVIVAEDGRIINSLALIYAVREIEGIERFRITQKTPTLFHIELVANGLYSTTTEERIRKNWGQLLRSAVTVTFEYPAALPLERSGKFRHVISEVRASGQHPQGQRV